MGWEIQAGLQLDVRDGTTNVDLTSPLHQSELSLVDGLKGHTPLFAVIGLRLLPTDFK